MVRKAKIEDLPSIACVHAKCFPDSYSTQLSKGEPFNSKNLLALFYKEFLDDNPELFVVVEDLNKSIVGFCMGYYMEKDDQMNNFIKHNRARVFYKTLKLLLSGNKPTWKKLRDRFRRKTADDMWIVVNNKYDCIKNNERGDLLSVCVLPECQGRGYAQELMNSYLSEMKKMGRKLCLLSVKKDNIRARKYYERNGFEIYRKRGNIGLTYMKLL